MFLRWAVIINIYILWLKVDDANLCAVSVYKDIAIATYLILLWRDTYKTPDGSLDQSLDTEPWKRWPQPPGGFLDFGCVCHTHPHVLLSTQKLLIDIIYTVSRCGNGLLTHILISEGYKGSGIDLRARNSWANYPPSTQEHLKVHAFNPSRMPDGGEFYKTHFPAGVFIIGNHADELTPWLPVVAAHTSAAGYLSIPCCAWGLETRFERSSTPRAYPYVPDLTPTLGGSHEGDGGKGEGKGERESRTGTETDGSKSGGDRLRLGGVPGDASWASTYSVYRIWLAGLSEYCGWEVECDTLRIPSTRNWAIVGG